MRLALVCLLLSTTLVARAADAEFLRVWPGWRDASAFERIGEYFGRKENSRREIVLRTQADAHSGFYFLVRVKAARAQIGARFELSVILPDAPEPKSFLFPADLPPKETVFQLGLTGRDWPEQDKAHPVAWKLALVSAEGHVLAEKKSFLWEQPAK